MLVIVMPTENELGKPMHIQIDIHYHLRELIGRDSVNFFYIYRTQKA